MTQTLDLLGLEPIIWRLQAAGIARTPNGSIFICPLEGGPLRYLHKIFDARPANRRHELRTLLRFPPPDDYSAFMNQCNGVTLFDNCYSIYGLGTEVNRGLRLEDQRPILLPHEIEAADALYGSSYPWRRIGSVAGYEQSFELEICRTGEAGMRSVEGAVRAFPSFREMVCALARLFDQFVSERGFRDTSQQRMDGILMDFLQGKEAGSPHPWG